MERKPVRMTLSEDDRQAFARGVAVLTGTVTPADREVPDRCVELLPLRRLVAMATVRTMLAGGGSEEAGLLSLLLLVAVLRPLLVDQVRAYVAVLRALVAWCAPYVVGREVQGRLSEATLSRWEALLQEVEFSTERALAAVEALPAGVQGRVVALLGEVTALRREAIEAAGAEVLAEFRRTAGVEEGGGPAWN